MFSIIFQTILSEIKSIYNWKVFWWPVSEFSGSSLHLAFQFAACFSCNRCQSYTAQRKESATAAISREARATHSFQRRAHALVPWDPTRWKLPTLLCPENKKWRAVMVKSFTRNRWMISSRLKVPNYRTQENSCVTNVDKSSIQWNPSSGFINAAGYGGSSVVVLCFPLVTNLECRCSMASSTFRGRRVVDPIPLQRGPLPRDRKYPSSFSGSRFKRYFNNAHSFPRNKFTFTLLILCKVRFRLKLTLLFWSNRSVY